MLAERVAPARVETAHDAGWSIDSLEAQAFAYLAVRSLHGLPITFPGTTGVPRPLCGGVLARPWRERQVIVKERVKLAVASHDCDASFHVTRSTLKPP